MWSKKRIVWFVLMIFTMTVIFYFSGQRTEVSGEASHNVAVTLNIETQYEWEEPSNIPLMFGMTLRKWAHVFLFALLGLFSVGVFQNGMYSLMFCYAYAVFDEFHQYFVPGRTASFMDTFVDALGFVPIILVFTFFSTVLKKIIDKKLGG